jgi:hypothetical protein
MARESCDKRGSGRCRLVSWTSLHRDTAGCLEQSLKDRAQLVERGPDAAWSGHDENVKTVGVLGASISQNRADAPPHQVSLDSTAQLSARGETEAIVVAVIWNEADDHEPVGTGTARRPDAGEIMARP